MEELSKKQQNIRFIGAGASHQNGASERATKTVVAMERTMLMHAELIRPKDMFSTNLWTMKIYYDVWVYNRVLICSMDYPLLKYSQVQDLIQCKKTLATVMFWVVKNMSWNLNCISL